MNSRGTGGKASVANTSSNSPSKGKSVSEVSSAKVEQLSTDTANISLDAAQDDGKWKVISRKSKNRGGGSGGAAKPWGSTNGNQKAWGHPDAVQKFGMRNNASSGRAPGNSWTTQAVDSKRTSGKGNPWPQASSTVVVSNQVPQQPVIRPPLEHGWNWQSRHGSALSKDSEYGQKKDDDVDAKNEDGIDDEEDEEDDDDDDAMDDTDDELLSEEFDSDASEKSHDSRKKNRWFKKFFGSLDVLSVEQINEPERQWHCPACQGGPGAIDWYRGLQPLMTHAKTKGSKRVKLHRELAELLDEELRRRGTSIIPAGEVFGKWKGLMDDEKDHEIVWPPMVIVMNTKLDLDENEKWIGMGNQELLDYFDQYAAVKARHSYGPHGHRGMSLLIFESSPTGYFEAERLHKHFVSQGTDRNAWNRLYGKSYGQQKAYNSGDRQLYGYMALKEDLDIFNQHSQARSKLKFEMRSYHEMVVKQLNQMSEDNQKLIYFKNMAVREQKHKKALEQSFGIVTEKLRKTMEENRIVRQRTQVYHEQQKEEMDFQEQFFKDQMNLIHEERDAQEEKFEKLQQEEREKVKQLNANSSNKEEYKQRAQELEKFIQLQDKEMEDYVARRDMLIKLHEEKLTAMKQRHWEELVGLEKDFDAELTSLMNVYTPQHSEGTAND